MTQVATLQDTEAYSKIMYNRGVHILRKKNIPEQAIIFLTNYGACGTSDPLNCDLLFTYVFIYNYKSYTKSYRFYEHQPSSDFIDLVIDAMVFDIGVELDTLQHEL